MDDAIEKYKDHVMDPKVQQEINQPLQDDTGFNEGHEDFLKMLIDKITSGELDPLKIQTLYNQDVYEKLSEEDQEKADLTGANILGIVKQIQKLWEIEKKPSFQIQNLVETVFQMKSRFEKEHGDVYII